MLEREVGLPGSLVERGEILGVFGQTPANGCVDEVGQAVLGLRSLHAKSPVQARVEYTVARFVSAMLDIMTP